MSQLRILLRRRSKLCTTVSNMVWNNSHSNGLVIWNLGRRQGGRRLSWAIWAGWPITEQTQENFSLPPFKHQLRLYTKWQPYLFSLFMLIKAGNLISICTPHMSLYIKVMVTLCSLQSQIFISVCIVLKLNVLFRCSKTCMVQNKTNLPAFFNLIICLQKLKWSNAFWEFED